MRSSSRPSVRSPGGRPGCPHGSSCWRGRSNQDIARELSIAKVTVRTHVSHILDKLGVSNRVEAVLHALRSGLAKPESR